MKFAKSSYSTLFWDINKSLNVEVGINVEGGIFWKKLVHNSNKRVVEGGSFLWSAEFFKTGRRDFTFIREVSI